MNSTRIQHAVVRLIAPLLFPATLYAADHPKDGGDGIGLNLRLESSWTTIMVGEDVQYLYILENAADKPIPVAIPVREYGFGWPAGGQAFLEPEIQTDEPMFSVYKATWPPCNSSGNPPEAWGELKPGDRITWNHDRLPLQLFATSPAGSIRAHWLLDEGRWISSEIVRFRSIDAFQKRKVVFTEEWSSYGYGKDHCKGEAFIVQLDDAWFLLWDKTRVTKVNEQDQYEHRIDERGTNLEITIKGDGGVRKKYFHLRHGLVGDQPWPIGPVSLYYPKPEPIPPGELAELRKKLGLAPDGSVLPVAASSATGGKDEKPPNPETRETGSFSYWLWLLAGALVVAILLLLPKLARKS